MQYLYLLCDDWTNHHSFACHKVLCFPVSLILCDVEKDIFSVSFKSKYLNWSSPENT